MNVGLAGNIGTSFAQQVAQHDFDYYVLEISSFQLDDIHSFAPSIGVITNITPDHLDRYNCDFSQYVASKLRLDHESNRGSVSTFNADDAQLTKAIEQTNTKAIKFPFGRTVSTKPGATFQNETIKINTTNTTTMINTTQFPLQGRHNLLNAMAAASVASLLDISKDSIRNSLLSFTAVEHRLERVLKIQNRTYINDSKATNVNATFYALESMEGQTVWIVGGVDKGNDYSSLLPLVREKVKAIICLGVDNDKIIDSFSPVVDLLVETQSMREAVKMAHQLADKREYVLLSPACASFDLFKNYEDRGNQFKEAVKRTIMEKNDQLIQGDLALWGFLALLAIFSFFPVFSASSNLSYVVGNGTPWQHLFKHMIILVMGFAVMIAIHRIPYHYFKGISILMLPIVILLLIYTVSQGATIGGANASRWIRIPFVGIGFQTSTLASLVLMMYVARYLDKTMGQQLRFEQTLLPLWLPVGIVIALILPANLSTAVIVFTMVFLLCFFGGISF